MPKSKKSERRRSKLQKEQDKTMKWALRKFKQYNAQLNVGLEVKPEE